LISFIRHEARWLSAGMLMTAASGFGQTYFISLSNADLREAFDLSHGRIGLIYAVATLASAIILLEFGKIVDHRSTRVSALLATLGLAAACAMLALTATGWMLLAAFLGLRLFGQGMLSHVAMTATGRWFDAQRGRAVSLVSLGYPLSEVILPPVAVAAFMAFGWRQTWLMAALLLCVVCAPVLFALLAKDRSPAGPDTSLPGRVVRPAIRQWRRGEVLREWSFWLMLMGILAPAFMVTGLFFHHQHLIELKGWSGEVFAYGFSFFALVAIGASLLAGALVDRFAARSLLPVYLLPMAAGLCLPLVFDGAWVIFALMGLLGLMAGAAATVMGAIWPELYGVEYLGEIRALSFSAMVASSAASPFILGVLIDAGIAFTWLLGVMGGYALLASGLMGLIHPRLSAIASEPAAPLSED